MKITELVLIIILAIILSVSKVTDSLQKENKKITEGKTIKDTSNEPIEYNSFRYIEMNIAFNEKTQEITFLDNSRSASGHFNN